MWRNQLDKPDLSFVSTEDLLHELEERHDSMVFGTVQDHTDDQQSITIRFRGSILTCLGVLALLRHHLEIAWVGTATEELEDQ
jgi:hypothetical protein